MKPLSLVFIRHGKSKLNSINRRLRLGDLSGLTPESLAMHDSQFPLTEEGREQAEAAGKWLKENINGGKFDYYYVSPYRRTLETALLLNLPKANWRMDDRLREIDWGIANLMTEADQNKLFPREMAALKKCPFSARRPSGESARDVVIRDHDFLGTIYRECGNTNVIIVSHGEVMTGFRYLLERQTEQEYNRLKNTDNPHERIHNCQIVQYSRLNPHTGELEDNLNWVRSICPWDLSRSINEWKPIIRKKYSNKDLAKYIAEFFQTPA